MPNVPIDVPLPDNITKFLARPDCLDIALPPPGKAELRLPLGGTIKGIADVTKGIPDDCSLTFSLLLQLGPILASIECLVKVLGLIKPLIKLVDGLNPPDPIKLGSSVPEFLKAAEAVLPCVTALTVPALNIIPFVKDLLCLFINLLHCITGQLKSIAALMGGLQLSIQAATEAGNTELLAHLQCAQENAASSAAHVMTGIEPITMLLSLAEPFLTIAGVSPITIPALGSAEDAAGLNQVIDTLDQISSALKLAVEPLGGC